MSDLYQPRNAAELRNQFLRDIRLAAIDSGVTNPPIEPNTDWWFLGDAVANISVLGFANQNSAEDASNALDATGDDLDHIREGLGLPEVPATGATGKIVVTVSGSVTVPSGTEFVYPNGMRGQTTATYVNPSTGDELSVAAIDTGLATNLKADSIVRFRSPPVNLATEAKVSKGSPLKDGTDAESDNRKRDRILNVYKNKPSGTGSDASWARIRQYALDSLGTVQDCYVYPALGGPASCKIVPVKDFDIANLDFSRALSSNAVTTVRTYLQEKLGIPEENVVQTCADQNVDVTVLFDVPTATTDGGSGLGWTDPSPWPALEAGDSYKVTISAVASTNDQITVTAATTTAPTAGITHVAWWSTVDRKFYPALVTAQSGSTGAWVLTLDRPLVASDGTGPSTGDYVCPSALNLERYGVEWVNAFRSLGPGENTSDATRVPRALRHPLTTQEDPCSLNNAVLSSIARQFTEISDYSYGYRSTTTPTVPGAVSTAPNILIPRKFAVYKLT